MHRRMDNLIPYDDEAAGPRLRAIAEQLVRLAPSRTDPHAYFEQKSSMVDELRTLARQVEGHLPSTAVPHQTPPDRVRPDPASLDRYPVAATSAADTDQRRPSFPPLCPVADRQPPADARAQPYHSVLSCRHCVRRRAQQSRRHRLRLRNVDLFEWADYRL
jgi:hypothetical protein